MKLPRYEWKEFLHPLVISNFAIAFCLGLIAFDQIRVNNARLHCAHVYGEDSTYGTDVEMKKDLEKLGLPAPPVANYRHLYEYCRAFMNPKDGNGD